jgi:hypothetical protein
MRTVHKTLGSKPIRKTPIWRRSCKWEDGIKMGLKAIGCASLDWIHLTQDAEIFVNGNELLDCKISREFLDKMSSY